ncbi:MAG: hypothetical protein ACRDQX_09100 [Pseudonocardiaceae bacterium]
MPKASTLLGVPYTTSQMSYDPRRLRLKGLITRLPRTNTYILTVFPLVAWRHRL